MSAALVVGGGVDALVAAHVLARSGMRVTLLEEFASPSAADGWVPDEVARAVGISDLVLTTPDPWLRAVLPDGGTLELWRDVARSAESIGRASARDAAQWPRFCSRMRALAGLLERLYCESPPSLVELRFALRVRALGRRGMEDLMRTLPMPAAELLDDWFECDALKGALGALAVRDIQQGPRSAGTALRLLHLHAGSPAGVFRPSGSNFAERLKALPGVVLRNARVKRVVVRAGRAAAVSLDDGTEIAAQLVVSSAPPARTLVEWIEPGWLDTDLTRALRHVRSRGVAAKVRFELAQPCAPLTLAPSLDHVERAYDDAKYGRVSQRPCLDLTASSAGAEVHFQYAPYRLAAGEWTDARRAALADQAAQLLAPHLPTITGRSVAAPPDLETAAGCPQGQPHHAELALDQALWMRPLPELARYRTPIEGLWLCGPAMHPGAGVAGAAGYNCARAILRA